MAAAGSTAAQETAPLSRGSPAPTPPPPPARNGDPDPGAAPVPFPQRGSQAETLNPDKPV